jgi:hypothetical protein
MPNVIFFSGKNKWGKILKLGIQRKQIWNFNFIVEMFYLNPYSLNKLKIKEEEG